MLNKWTNPESYFGETWEEYYVFLGQNRDSDSLTRSNFDCGLAAIGGESDTVHVVRERHWACGWIEWIAIHESDAKTLSIAADISAKLQDYPVLNEIAWSELQWNEASDFWAGLSISERIDYCRDAGLSIFAARRDYIPDDETGAIFDLLSS